MNSLLIALMFTWPAECEVLGEAYLEAAKIRDGGLKIEQARGAVRTEVARMALGHVYMRPDLNPEQWRYIAIGACIGAMDKSPEPKRERSRPARMVS